MIKLTLFIKAKLKRYYKILNSPLRAHHFSSFIILRSRYFLMPLAAIYRRMFLRGTRIIVVTGSFGKTTATRAIKAALFSDPNPVENINTESKVALGVLGLRPKTKRAVFEIGIDRPGRMSCFAWMLKPDIVAVTSIGSEHCANFGTIENIRNEKAKSIKALSSSSFAILNGDDANVIWMKNHTKAKVVTFGMGGNFDVSCIIVKQDWPHHTRMEISGFNQKKIINTKLFGKPMAYSILIAAAVALVEGFSLENIAPFLEVLKPTPGRLDPVFLPDGAWLIRDEFKGSLETFTSAFDFFETLSAERVIVIVGQIFEPIEPEEEVYEMTGKRLAKIADIAIFIGSELQFQAIIRGASLAGPLESCFIHARNTIPDGLKAITNLIPGPGDIILLKGCSELRLERIVLALIGKDVRCSIFECTGFVNLRCDDCQMLQRA